MSANTISRLKQHWIEEHRNWCQRDLSRSCYVYWWADGIYSNVRMDDRLCLLVIIGITGHGHKELVAVEDGYRESEASWAELLSGLRSRGLTTCPKLAIGDGALGFWKALGKCYPEMQHQRCWVHKTANILSTLPKSVQPKVKAALHETWMAQTRDEAYNGSRVGFVGMSRWLGSRSLIQPRSQRNTHLCERLSAYASICALSCFRMTSSGDMRAGNGPDRVGGVVYRASEAIASCRRLERSDRF